MAKHFQISIGEDAFSFTKNPLSIAAEAALDGIYVIRTSLPAEHSDAAATVRAYKSLSGVEHAFRSLETVDLKLPQAPEQSHSPSLVNLGAWAASGLRDAAPSSGARQSDVKRRAAVPVRRQRA
jgi:hypothetical protein